MKFSWSFARGLLLQTMLFMFACGAPVGASDRTILVDMDYARIVKVPEGASTLVIGNPLVADVTMLKNSPLMVITGKSFGTTNLIVLDRTGAQVGESVITVVSARDKVVVNRGGHRESYSCKPDCLPSIDLADDNGYMQKVIESARAHDTSLSAGKR